MKFYIFTWNDNSSAGQVHVVANDLGQACAAAQAAVHGIPLFLKSEHPILDAKPFAVTVTTEQRAD